MKYLLIAGLLFMTFTQTSCYYDNHEFLNPATNCDTATVTYSGTISPILTANCTGCHSGTNAPNNIRLDVYGPVKAQASNGFLVGVITHASGFSPMPKNGSMLSDCSITKIKKWVAAGAPNN